MKIITTVLALGLTGLVAPTAFAHDFTVGEISVSHPHTYETARTAKTGAGYMVISNDGDTADTLLEVRSSVPKTMIHRSSVDAQGVATMKHVMGGVEIPAGEAVEFAKGGLHVMFMGLEAPLEDGAAVDATLVFENAGELEVEFKIQSRDKDEADHGNMKHSETKSSN